MLAGVRRYMDRYMRRRYMALPWVAVSIGLWPGAAATAPVSAERILDESGGRIGSYLSRYEAIRKTGQHVAIDGTCASACTLLLGVIPHNRICVTPRAVLAFHAA